MKIEDLLQEWSSDSVIDKTELGDESLRTISLHAKWKELYIKEKAAFLKTRAQVAELSFKKYEFYTQGHTPETKELGWELPDTRIIKANVDRYMDADKDIIKANLQLALMQEKVDFCIDIIKEISNRRWAIKNAIEWLKWTQGG